MVRSVNNRFAVILHCRAAEYNYRQVVDNVSQQRQPVPPSSNNKSEPTRGQWKLQLLVALPRVCCRHALVETFVKKKERTN